MTGELLHDEYLIVACGTGGGRVRACEVHVAGGCARHLDGRGAGWSYVCIVLFDFDVDVDISVAGRAKWCCCCICSTRSISFGVIIIGGSVL